MRSEQNMNEHQKSNKFKWVVILLVILVAVVGATGYALNQKKSSNKGETEVVKKKNQDEGAMTKKRSITEEDKKNMEISLESLQKLYSDKKTRELRLDISNEELEAFKSDYDKIGNPELKSQFESEYKRIVESRQ